MDRSNLGERLAWIISSRRAGRSVARKRRGRNCQNKASERTSCQSKEQEEALRRHADISCGATVCERFKVFPGGDCDSKGCTTATTTTLRTAKCILLVQCVGNRENAIPVMYRVILRICPSLLAFFCGAAATTGTRTWERVKPV